MVLGGGAALHAEQSFDQEGRDPAANDGME